MPITRCIDTTWAVIDSDSPPPAGSTERGGRTRAAELAR